MPTATVTAIAAGTYSSDPVHSNVSFTVRHFGAGKFRGGFAEAQATLRVSDAGELKLAGDVQAASVQVKEPHLAAHLKAPDFFDVERYPEIKFRSTDVTVGDDGTLEIDGDLTIKATTKRVHASGEITYSPADPEGNPRVGIELSTTIDRTEFGVDFAAQLPGGIPVAANEVTLIAELELRKVGQE
jgi:polyisoprenoid-binding protein YceI